MMIALVIIERILLIASGFITSRIVPYLGFFPYREELTKYHLPRYIYTLGNFDGIHYVQIARRGYEQYTQAYFPLYPALISLGGYLVHNHLLVAICIANVSALIGFVLWQQFVHKLTGNKTLSLWAVGILLTFPTSLFFSAAYTESVFFIFVTICFLLLTMKKPVWSGVAAYFGALTRFMGGFLVIPLAFAVLTDKSISLQKKIIALLLPIAGLGTYMYYLWITFHDPLYFIHAQAAFGANRETHVVLLPIVLYRYIKIFVTATHNLQYYISILEFTTFCLVSLVLLFDLYKGWIERHKKNNYLLLGISLFSLLTLLIPASSGTLSSIPRYALLAPSFFIAIPTYFKSKWMLTVIVSVSFILQILLFGLFVQGYFVS